MTDLSMMPWLLLASTLGIAFCLLAVTLKLRKQIASLQQTASELSGTLQTQAQSNIGLGRKLKQLEGRMRLQESMAPKHGAHEKGFMQASKLARMGASADELSGCAGISRSEAELLVSLHERANA